MVRLLRTVLPSPITSEPECFLCTCDMRDTYNITLYSVLSGGKFLLSLYHIHFHESNQINRSKRQQIDLKERYV